MVDRGSAAQRALLSAVLCTVAFGSMPAASAAATLSSDLWYRDGATARWRIAGDWSFVADPGNVGHTAGWARTMPSGGRSVRIPHVWNADLDEDGFKGTVGWYFVRFRPPRAGTYRIRFLSTHHQATAFVDGKSVGMHQGGFMTWETRAVRLDEGSHLLALRADNREAVAVVPTGGHAWWNWGGISREVELREVNPVDVGAVRVGTAKLDRRSATVRVDVLTSGATSRVRSGAIKIALAGRTLVRRAVRVRPDRLTTTTFWVRFRRPRLWSPQDPSLYRLDVFTGRGGRMRRAWTGKVGVRRIESRDGVLRLNGVPFFGRGAALHDMARDVGAALTPADFRANLSLLRGLHANFTRSHYPMHPGFLEMLDRAGIVVWAEAPVIWLTDAQLGTPVIRQTSLSYLRQTIDAMASHASVGMWSAGNELAGEAPQGQGFVGYVRAARDLTRSLDPTRPFTVAFESRRPQDYAPFCALLDLIGLNSYLGWYYGPSPGLEQQRALREDLATKLSVCPQTPWMVTEFGAEAGFAASDATRGSYGYQENYIDSTLQALQAVPRLAGASIWAGRDFAVAPGWTGGNTTRPNPPINQKGLVTLTGRQKPAYRVASWWFQRLAARRVNR